MWKRLGWSLRTTTEDLEDSLHLHLRLANGMLFFVCSIRASSFTQIPSQFSE